METTRGRTPEAACGKEVAWAGWEHQNISPALLSGPCVCGAMRSDEMHSGSEKIVYQRKRSFAAEYSVYSNLLL
jgi:hypothetical protein